MRSLLWMPFVFLSLAAVAATPHAVLTQDKLLVDGKAAPFLFGAELQYFRARGGPGRNVPRAEVERLWNRLVDRVVEAKMNTAILYIPWDFHEPAEGVFDFDGTLDQDHDGKPDYPSRNLRGFLDLLVARGIRHIMVRPGPYINAEWGPTGFGAIPLWFLEKYPASLAKTLTSGKPRTASFGDEVYRDRARRWLVTLHERVLKHYMGPGKPVVFLQLDNETNYFWDSVYERDRSPGALGRYRAWLFAQYGAIEKLNAAYGTKLAGFRDVDPPTGPKDLRHGWMWHYDWYLFHDVEIREYYAFLKDVWRSLGVSDGDVLFTSCDSFNVLDHGLLPRLDWRQETSSTTLNIYPKTDGTQAQSTLNTPMKAAHDARLMASAHAQFGGTGGNWVFSTETVGGWFPPTEVSLATRQHTWGSLLGSGVKAMTIYYFHEGYNWNGLEKQDTELKFDAPLDKDMKPRASFALLKRLGAALAGGLGDLAVAVRPVSAPVLLAHDNDHQYPIPGKPDASIQASTDADALFGLLREAGALADVAYLDGMTDDELARYRLVVWQNPGYLFEGSRAKLERYVARGGRLVVIGEDPKLGASGKVTRFEKSPADGWNDDRYGKLADPFTPLAAFRKILAEAGVVSPARVTALDAGAYLHGWLSAGEGKRLLSIENFARAPRRARLVLAQEARMVTLTRRFGLEGEGERIRVSGAALATEGVELPVSPDGVDLWEITGGP